MLLPPILGQVREAFGVSYTQIALALTAFNVASALLQTPAGFLVDRIGPRLMLTAGLILAGAAITAAALLPGYWFFVTAYALMGVANTVYHPADYSILSAAIDGKKIGKAFSIHTFAGYLGFGVTPAMVLACAAIWDWRGAFLFAAGLSFAVALLLIVAGSVLPRVVRKSLGSSRGGPSRAEAKVGLGLLLSPPILRNLLFFFCLAMASGGIQTFTVVGLGALHGTPASVANIALSGFLLCSAGGVLLGGIIADRTPHHERVAAVGFACTAAMAILMAWVNMPAAVLIGVMSLGGLLNGIIQPSRDMMVRAVTPPGSFGKVFGFVTTGFNLGGMISPLLFAWLMDRGEPRAIFMIVVAFIFLALVTVITRAKPQAKAAWTP
jgi:FSR family fosmidomycin resistance protein-like MFS transporter